MVSTNPERLIPGIVKKAKAVLERLLDSGQRPSVMILPIIFDSYPRRLGLVLTAGVYTSEVHGPFPPEMGCPKVYFVCT